jgi:hypothetical protein
VVLATIFTTRYWQLPERRWRHHCGVLCDHRKHCRWAPKLRSPTPEIGPIPRTLLINQPKCNEPLCGPGSDHWSNSIDKVSVLPLPVGTGRPRPTPNKYWFWPWNNEFGWKKCRHSSNPGKGPERWSDFSSFHRLLPTAVRMNHERLPWHCVYRTTSSMTSQDKYGIYWI